MHRYRLLCLLLILLVSGVVRIWGNGFGLPYLYHPDEGAVIMPALKILHTGNFNPGRFDYGSVFIYILFFVYIFYFLVGVRQGVFQVVQDIPFYDNLLDLKVYEFPSVFVIGRSVSALFSMAIVLVIYFLAKRLFGEKVGLVASLLVAVFPPLVLDAHFATTDTTMTFFVLLATYLSVQLYESGDAKRYVWAGFVVGIAISTKYAALPCVIVPIAAHVLRNWQTRTIWDAKLLGLTSAAVLAGFFIGSPFIIADFVTFLNFIAYLIRLYSRPGSPPPLEPTYIWWLKHMFTTEVWLLMALYLPGLGYLLWKKPKETVLLSAFPALYWIILLMQTTRFPRNWLPTAPILILLAAYFLVRLGERISVMRSFRPAYVLIALLVPLVGFWGFVAAQYDWRMTQTDVRTIALAWVEENLPAHSRIAIDAGGPPLSGSTREVHYLVRIGCHPLDWYQDQGFDYLIISQPMREEMNLNQEFEGNYRSIEKGADLIGDLKGYWLNQDGQHIWVYKVPQAAGAIPKVHSMRGPQCPISTGAPRL